VNNKYEDVDMIRHDHEFFQQGSRAEVGEGDREVLAEGACGGKISDVV